MSNNPHGYEKSFYEYLAKRVLETYFPAEYSELELSDIPDLKMSDGNGVEVTRALYDGDAESSFIFSTNMGKPIEEVPPRRIERLEQLGYEFMEYQGKVIGCGPKEAFWETTNEIERAFNNKLDKRPNYKGIVNLFIYAPSFDCYDEAMMQLFTERITELQSNKHAFYEKVYVMDYKSIYVCETRSKRTIRIMIEKELMDNLAFETRNHTNTLYNERR